MPDPSSPMPGILFTAFEPSGDTLAAALIEELKRREPDRPIYALGGAKMEKAGADLIEYTTEHAVMMLGVVSQIQTHRKRLKRLGVWLESHPIAAHVPVDSPAANWSVSDLVKKTQPTAKVVHLVLPQVWAWATWRVKKLKRLSDRVLCIMPFEPTFLDENGLEGLGVFVGHPLADEIGKWDEPGDNEDIVGQGGGRVGRVGGVGGVTRIAMLPGSRRSEIDRNWPIMLGAFRELRKTRPNLVARIATIDSRAEAMVRRKTQEMTASRFWSDGLEFATGDIRKVLGWADAVLVVSGTASFEAGLHGKPMVIVYRMGRLFAAVAKAVLVKARTYTLPNLISEWLGRGRAVPELVPLVSDDASPVARELGRLIDDAEVRQKQREDLREVASQFWDKRFAETAADELMDVIGDRD